MNPWPALTLACRSVEAFGVEAASDALMLVHKAGNLCEALACRRFARDLTDDARLLAEARKP